MEYNLGNINNNKFRNSFHLEPYVLADFMIPCGGRPESININNVECTNYI